MQIYELNQSKQAGMLIESMCKDLTRDQRRIVEGIVNELRPLFETTLDANQIQSIFKQAQEKQDAKGGGERTLIGKAVDTTGKVAASANQTINKLGKYLQDTRTVQYFDQKFENLKQQITTKLGADSKITATIDQLGQYAKTNPGKTAFVIGTLTAIAALATGPAGGAVAGQVLRGATELLKGEKLSTAVGKGAKSAALGAVAGYGAQELGSMLSGTVQAVADNLHPGVSQLKLNWRNLGGTIADINVHGLPQDIKPIQTAWRQAVAAYSNGDINGATRYLTQVDQLVDKISTPQYIAKLAPEIADQQKWQAGADAFKKVVDGAVAATQGAVQATTAKTAAPAAQLAPAQPAPAQPAPAQPAAQPTARPGLGDKFKKAQRSNAAPANFNQVREGYSRLTNSEIREIFAIAGGQLTEGPTWDKIKSVGSKIAQVGKSAAQQITNKQVNAKTLFSHWENSGKPDDSGIIADILRRGNVTDDVIKDIYSAMGIEINTPASTGRPREEPAAAQPASAVRPSATGVKSAASTSAPSRYGLAAKTPDEIVAELQKTLSPAAFNEVATLMLKSKMSGMNKPK